MKTRNGPYRAVTVVGLVLALMPATGLPAVAAERALASRGQDVERPRGQDVERPRGQDAERPRGQDVERPRGQDAERPRAEDTERRQR